MNQSFEDNEFVGEQLYKHQTTDEDGNPTIGVQKIRHAFRLLRDDSTCTLKVEIPIYFGLEEKTAKDASDGQARAIAVKKKLEAAMENGQLGRFLNGMVDEVWSNKYRLCCNDACKKKGGWRIAVRVVPLKARSSKWMAVGLHAHQQNIDVHQLSWNVTDLTVVGHEVGHFLGNPDEYKGAISSEFGGKKGAFNASADHDSLMDVGVGGAVRSRNFGTILRSARKLLNDQSCVLKNHNGDDIREVFHGVNFIPYHN